MSKQVLLQLYSKADCPLCEEMEEAAREAARFIPLDIVHVDVTTDPKLFAAYGMDIPLLFHNGSCIAKHRVTAAELTAKLRRRLGR